MSSKQSGSEVSKSSTVRVGACKITRQQSGRSGGGSSGSSRCQTVDPAIWISSLLIISSLCLLAPTQANADTAGQQQSVATSESASSAQQQQQQRQQQQHDQKNALEAELSSLVQQYSDLDGGKRVVDELASRLMAENGDQFESDAFAGQDGQEAMAMAQPALEFVSGDIGSSGANSDLIDSETGGLAAVAAASNSIDSMRLKKLLRLLQSYEENAQPAYASQYPALPFGQASAMKRAVLMQPRFRNNYDFGLGKRPDAGLSKIARFGDQVATVSQFGKRPGAHRYDFGLGKRVASVSSQPRFQKHHFNLIDLD